MLTVDSVVSRVTDVLSTQVDGEYVLMSPDLTYHGVEGVGNRIWDLLDEPMSVAELVAAIIAEYDVTPEQAESDLVGFIGEMQSKGLMTIS